MQVKVANTRRTVIKLNFSSKIYSSGAKYCIKDTFVLSNWSIYLSLFSKFIIFCYLADLEKIHMDLDGKFSLKFFCICFNHF